MASKSDWPVDPCKGCEYDDHCNWYKTCDAFRSWVRQVLARFRRNFYAVKHGRR